MLPLQRTEDSPVARRGSHEPVMLRETVDLLGPRAGSVLVDGTLGAGGHAEVLLEAIGPEGRLIGIDRDRTSLEETTARLTRFGSAFVPLHGNHREMRRLLEGIDVHAVDGILLDLGVSSMQLDDPARGFSFRADGPLDMRMDPTGDGPTAADLLARLSRDELARILREYGEERQAGRIATAICRAREQAPLERTLELASLVQRTLGPAARRYRIDPATRTFQALRIAVNDEIAGLEALLVDASALLRRGGRLACISFHSLEDRAVKHTLRSLAERCVCPPKLPVCGCGREDVLRLVTRRPVRPAPDETERNPRARSAKLRVAERL